MKIILLPIRGNTNIPTEIVIAQNDEDDDVKYPKKGKNSFI